MSQPFIRDGELRNSIDTLITADGDPAEDAVAVIAYTLELALGPASGGMSQSEWEALAKVASTLVDVMDTKIHIPEGRSR